MSNAPKHVRIASTKIGKKEFIISKNVKGGYTLGTRIMVDDGVTEPFYMFLKGGIDLPDYNSLLSLTDMLDQACEKIDEEELLQDTVKIE